MRLTSVTSWRCGHICFCWYYCTSNWSHKSILAGTLGVRRTSTLKRMNYLWSNLTGIAAPANLVTLILLASCAVPASCGVEQWRCIVRVARPLLPAPQPGQLPTRVLLPCSSQSCTTLHQGYRLPLLFQCRVVRSPKSLVDTEHHGVLVDDVSAINW